jgi:hypothetical protein
MNRTLIVPQCLSRRFLEERKSLSPDKIRPMDRPARNLVARTTVLSRLGKVITE